MIVQSWLLPGIFIAISPFSFPRFAWEREGNNYARKIVKLDDHRMELKHIKRKISIVYLQINCHDDLNDSFF
jgi:hypothetical protein